MSEKSVGERCVWCAKEYGPVGRPPHFASDPRCALAGGVFATDNWNCAGLRRLRRDASSAEHWNEDQHCAVLPIPDTGSFIVLSYYKSRGRTEGAWVVEEATCRTLKAEDVAAYEAGAVT